MWLAIICSIHVCEWLLLVPYMYMTGYYLSTHACDWLPVFGCSEAAICSMHVCDWVLLVPHMYVTGCYLFPTCKWPSSRFRLQWSSSPRRLMRFSDERPISMAGTGRDNCHDCVTPLLRDGGSLLPYVTANPAGRAMTCARERKATTPHTWTSVSSETVDLQVNVETCLWAW